jgi:hypothetical protein
MPFMAGCRPLWVVLQIGIYFEWVLNFTSIWYSFCDRPGRENAVGRCKIFNSVKKIKLSRSFQLVVPMATCRFFRNLLGDLGLLRRDG